MRVQERLKAGLASETGLGVTAARPALAIGWE